MRIHKSVIPLSMAEFHVRLTNYLLARVAHRLTENVAAPFPEHEIFRMIAEAMERGELVEIFDDAPAEIIVPELAQPADAVTLGMMDRLKILFTGVVK